MNASNSTSMPEELNDERLDYCGANFCSSLTIITNNSDSADPVSIIEKPSVELIQLLAGILGETGAFWDIFLKMNFGSVFFLK